MASACSFFDCPESLHEEVLTTVKKGCYSGSETKNRGRVTENQGAETRIETKMPRINH